MGRGDILDEQLVKTNSKLETFLKKSLTSKSTDKVRGYEPCIVVSTTENKSFKYVILDEDFIYLTENPPKHLQPIASLRDVKCVQVHNDSPQFLSGVEKENCQHVSVIYRHSHSTTSAISTNTLHSSSSGFIASTPTPTDFKPLISPALHSFDFTQGLTNCNQNNLRLINLSHDEYRVQEDVSGEIVPQSLQSEINSEQSIQAEKDSQHSRNSPWLSTQDSRIATFFNARNNLSLSNSFTSSNCSIFVPKPQNYKENIKKLPLLTEEEDTSFWRTFFCACWNNKANSTDFPAQPLDTSSQHAVLHTENSLVTSLTDTTTLKLVTASSNLNSCHRSQSFLTQSTSASVAPSMYDVVSNELITSESDVSILHLYLLTRNSSLMMLIHSAWLNYHVRSTLALSIRPTKDPFTNMDMSEYIDNTLKLFIMENKDVKSLIHICLNVKMLLEHSKAAQKLFLKNPQNFQFILKTLQSYVTTKIPKRITLQYLETRAEEIELAIVLVDVLIAAFNETEIYPFRITAFRGDRGRNVVELLVTLLSNVTTPESIASQNDEKSSCIHNKIAGLCDSFAESVTACVYEIFLVAKQGYWSRSEDPFFNTAWIVGTLEDMNNTERLIETLVNNIVWVILSPHSPEVSPERAVYFYKELFIIDVFIRQSKRLLDVIKFTHKEEFKYFMHSAIISQRIPHHYPITTVILPLIHKIKEKILTR